MRSRSRSEEGFTLVEILVTMSIMSVIGVAVTMVAFRAFQDTNTVTNRADVFADGRFALDQMTTQLRQEESIDAASTSTAIAFASYLDGGASSVAYRVTGTAAPYALERSVDGGTWVELSDSLASDQLFTYTQHDGITDQVTIDLHLQTNTTTVELTTDVYLRNA
jgi:prepilin-type N-terminal cleavage/methylation domain-containing protein